MSTFRTVSFLLWIALSFVTSVAAEDPSDPREAAKRMNMLFIAVDDLRPALGCYGDQTAVTPHIDSLAARGIVLNRAYCQLAVCSPSRLSLMTGRRPDSIRVWDLGTHFRTAAPDVVTLPQHFKNHGYHTQSIGKVYHGNGAPSKDPPSWSVRPAYDKIGSAEARYALPKNRLGRGLKRSATESADVDDGVYLDGMVCDAAESAINELSATDTPFFLAVGFRKPHLPFCAPKRYWDFYQRDEIRLPENPDHPQDSPELGVRSWKELEGYADIVDGEPLTEQKVKELRHGYYACVSYVDELIGRLLRTLKTKGIADNTVVVLWGDHGYHLGEQGLWTKANNYELSTRVPLILAVPGQANVGIKSNALVELVDVYPTLADVCGLKVPTAVEGISFKPLLAEPNRVWKKAVFSQYPRSENSQRHRGHGDIMGYALRTDRYRYVEWRNWETKLVVARELYDHQTDPHENRNVAAHPEQRQAILDLSERLSAGWRSASSELQDDANLLAHVPQSDRGAQEESEPPKPNVLFLCVDDMKDWVHCLGGYEGTVHTPNIDRLAKSGTLFTNAHCASPKCAPSRAAILTGRRPSTTGLYDNGHWWLPNLPDVVTIPKQFKNQGYRVVGAGKIFHHTAGNHPPNQWDAFHRLIFTEDPWFRGVKLNYPWSTHTPPPAGFPFSGVSGLGHENDWGTLPIEDNRYDDVRTTDYAVKFLRQKGNDKKTPFFLACGLFRPHLPWYAPKQYFDRYPLDEIVLPKVSDDDLNDLPIGGAKFAKARRGDFETIKNADKWKHAVRAYLASISYADDQLGRVLDALDESTQKENTIVVLWSDHGWHLGEKQHWHKTTLWEEATRVPLIISAPGYRPSVCPRPVSLLDIYPTLNDLAGFELDKSHDGTTLLPLMRNPNAEWNRPAVIEFQRGNAAVRTDRYRYIRYQNGGEELYDHRTDPDEWTNLAQESDFTELKEELRGWITKEWAESAPTKAAFHFDHKSFTWTNKKTGEIVRGGE